MAHRTPPGSWSRRAVRACAPRLVNLPWNSIRGSARSALHREEAPLPGTSWRLCVPRSIEAQARARDQVPDGAGDEDLTGCGAAQPPGTNVDRDAAHVWPLCTRSAATSCRWRGELDTEDTLRIYFLAFYVISLTVFLVKVVPASLKVPTPERRAKPPIWVLAVLPVLRAVVAMQKN